MSVENNALPETIDPERTTKEDAFAHGFGIPNIRKAVERYGGQCSVRAEEGRFVLKIMIPMPWFPGGAKAFCAPASRFPRRSRGVFPAISLGKSSDMYPFCKFHKPPTVRYSSPRYDSAPASMICRTTSLKYLGGISYREMVFSSSFSSDSWVSQSKVPASKKCAP